MRYNGNQWMVKHTSGSVLKGNLKDAVQGADYFSVLI